VIYKYYIKRGDIMSLILEAGVVCPYSNNCPHNTNHECWGAKKDRPMGFNCSYVKNGKIITDGTRLREDQTGKMKILME